MSRPAVPARAATLVVLVWLAGGIGRPVPARAAGDPGDPFAPVRALQAAERWSASESLATTVLTRVAAARPVDSLALAEGLSLLVQSRIQRQAIADTQLVPMAARVLAIRARHLPPEDPRIADAHHWLAYVYGPRGMLDSADVHVRRAYALRVNARAPDDTLIAESLRLMGLIARDRADFHAAADAFQHAYERRLRVHDENRALMGRLLAEQGNALRREGLLDSARAVEQHALAVDRRAVGVDGFECSTALDYLAQVERDAGNLALSIEDAQEALRIARLHYPEDNVFVVRILRNTSSALIQLGDYAGTRALMEQVMPAYVRTYGPDHPRVLSARSSLGTAFVGLGDTLAAMRELRTVERALAARPGPPDPLLATTLLWEAEALTNAGDHTAALAVARRAIPIARAARVPQWISLAELQVRVVLEQLALGDTAGLEAARQELVRLTNLRAVGSSAITQTLRLTNAMALRGLGRDREAWEEALAADRLARERVRANARSLPDRQALQLSFQDSPAQDFLIDMARSRPGRLAQAWDAIVQSRGLVGAEVAQRRLPRAARGDSALAGAHARWMAAERRHAQRLVQAAESADSLAGPELAALRAAAEDAERTFAALLAARGSPAPRPDVHLADVRARLAPGQALVGFVETGAAAGDSARLTALIARAGSAPIVRVELGRSSALRARLEPWRERLARSPGGDGNAAALAERACRAAGVAVRAAVWDPLTPHLAGVKELMVVPEGPVIGLPWQALPDRAGGYLVEHDPVFVLLDAERELLQAPAPDTAGALLAVGAPQFGALATQAVAQPARGGDPCAGGIPPLGPLPGTAAEVQDAGRAWRGPSHILTGDFATEARFKEQAPGHEVLHLATHGVVARDTCVAATPGRRGVGAIEPLRPRPRPAQRPAASTGRLSAVQPTTGGPSPWLGRRVWLALAGANDARSHTADENEGLLTAEEVLTLDLGGTAWAVLSACHSGVGEDWSREGALGMRRAFRLAGVRTVIASQWSVEDEATRAWMHALYAAREAGARRAADAVMRASRAVLAARRAHHRTTHPFYWAAFDAAGE